ncbi:MAG: AtpZ/AtpI family protein [Chloroflexota bacterium]
MTKDEARKIRARRSRHQSIWLGLGMLGTIGWAVAVPMLVSVALGIWIDRQWPSRYSWTLMLLLAGTAIGCLNAWYWITRELEAISRQKENGKHD